MEEKKLQSLSIITVFLIGMNAPLILKDFFPLFTMTLEQLEVICLSLSLLSLRMINHHWFEPLYIHHPTLNKQSKTKYALTGLLIICLYILTFKLIQQQFPKVTNISNNTSSLVNTIERLPFYTVSVVILSPILEEMLFRHVLFGWLTTKMNATLAAIIVGIIFSVAHLDSLFFPYFLLSIYLSYFYYKTGSLLTASILHITFNGLTVLFLQ